MNLLEKLLVTLAVVGVILKFSFVLGGDELLFLSMSVLSCLYYLFSFLFFNRIPLRNIFKRDAYNGVSAWTIVTTAVCGLGLSIICIGSLFKLLTFMGANQMLAIGLGITAVILAISVIRFLRKRDPTEKVMLWRTGIALIVALTLLLTPNVSIIRLQYRNHPAYIEAYSRYLQEPTNEALIRKKDLEYHRITMSPEEFTLYEKMRKDE